jgi:WD40 repeat protein/serine/threonine protein kinase
MSQDSHRRETELFGRALDVDVDEQRAFLERECGEDGALALRVLALLARDRESASTLDRSAVERLAPSAAISRAPEQIGSYRILGLLGAGGMGIVYRAEQHSPRRDVALKVIRGGLASVEIVRRFEKEAHVLARLDHQGIARVYDAGVFEGPAGPEPFVAMELVQGEPLLRHVERMQLSRDQRIELLTRVCDAVAHAHEHGVVHRDLKPSNVIVKSDGQPKVLDFGVALIVHGETDASTRQTSVGELIGTLPYMSPEQLSGDPERVDERSDVYALGVMAYEMLAGRLPHDLGGIPVPAAARIVIERTPARLGEIDRALRGDLETIVGKALEKDHEQRYACARELAADLRRFLRHEPVRAIPPSNLYYLRRFARRNPALTASLVLAAAFLVAGTAISTCQARRAEKLRVLADEEAKSAVHAARGSTLAAARIAAEHADFATSRRLLDSIEPAGRGWVWKWLRARGDGRIGIFTTESAARAASFLPSSNELAIAERSGKLTRWSFGGKTAGGELDLGAELTGSAAFDRDGAYLAGVNGADGEDLSVWDVSTGRRVANCSNPEDRPVVLAVAPGGGSVALGGRDSFLWRASESKPVAFPSRTSGPACFDFSPDGTRLACAHNPINDWPGWLLTLNVANPHDLGVHWQLTSDETTSVALGPDGRAVIGYRSKRAYVIDPDRREIVAELTGSQSPIRAVAFDRSGARVATGSDDGSVRTWDARNGRQLAVLSGASSAVSQVAFSPDGSKVLARSADQTSAWSLSSDPDVLRAHSSYVYAIAFVRGGKRLVSMSFDGELCVWDAASLELLRKAKRPGAPSAAYALAVCRDGELLGVTRGREVLLLDGDSLELLRTLSLDWPAEPRAVSFSPDGRLLAANTGADLALWDVESGAIRTRASFGFTTYYPAVVFSHDGRRFADSEGNTVVVRDAATGAVLARLEGHRSPVEALAFSPDDALLASGSVDRTVRVWDTRTWSVRSILEGHTDRVYSLTFSPDGEMLASGSNDSTIRLWSISAGEELALLTGHEDYVFALAFDPDGSRLVSASGDKTLRVWDTMSRSERWRAGELARARRDAVRARMADRLHADGDLAAAVRSVREDDALDANEREAGIQALLELAPGNER